MTERTFGPYKMRVDVARTRKYYASQPRIACGCAGCRNFDLAVRNLPHAVAEFYDALGLDPSKPAEACHYYGTPESVFTSAWHHIHGELVAGGPLPDSRQRYGEPFALSDGVSVSAAPDCDLLPDDFPRPCFQVEFWFERLPWVLDEPNPYANP